MKDYYTILELTPSCSIEEIKQAYRRLAKKYHPDVNKSPNAHQKFIEISEAYEVLLHETTANVHQEQQEQYDYEAFIREVIPPWIRYLL
ncbi:MAG TPA: DnaJ domain-containing protein [Bacteroidales bacterium]|nr:DnaJ domain-containing protein [Bacteroidales bacterium]